jgi:tetratricopeptide (TPR) repeat protein
MFKRNSVWCTQVVSGIFGISYSLMGMASDISPPLAEQVIFDAPAKIVATTLTRPIALTTLQTLFDEAERLYRQKQFYEAAQNFRELLSLEPALSCAWLRLGNVWQQMGQPEWASVAYQKATLSEPIQLERQPEDIRSKALLNLATLMLQKSKSAIDSLKSELLTPNRGSDLQEIEALQELQKTRLSDIQWMSQSAKLFAEKKSRQDVSVPTPNLSKPIGSGGVRQKAASARAYYSPLELNANQTGVQIISGSTR